ncbi:hypothetical protein RJ639_009253 [Escallonia herrerae]|uniref:hAT-like transposase RNase-H fold domain-containing protein n=1 Tax=Escallonia herrerae TaxID=1293975 RepID=A0AA89ASM1_9ASTE|nr:hypothetical protein RJ639_009253 [Escallonia herrerae]
MTSDAFFSCKQSSRGGGCNLWCSLMAAEAMPSSTTETTVGGISSSLPPKPDKKRLAPVPIVFDPRYKLKYVKFVLSQVCDTLMVKEVVKKVKENLVKLFEHYEKGDDE